MVGILAGAPAWAQIAPPVAPSAPAAPSGSAPMPAPQMPATNPFLGSIPTGTVTSTPLPLSLKEALQRALDHNLGLLLAEEDATGAHGARWRALAELLPNVSGYLRESQQVINLEAYGFKANPSLVGPFNIFDARVSLSQPVFDLGAINDARAASLNERAAKYGIKDARDLVTLVTVNLYLETVANQSRIAMAQAQLETADALYKQANDLKTSGLVAGIDVLRAQVQLQTQRQRLIVAQNEFEKAKLQLGRAIGLPGGQPITLTDKISYSPMPPLTVDQAIQRAYAVRPDYLAAAARLAAAQATATAARVSRLPSVHLDADYGGIGPTTATARATFTIAGTVRIPIFDASRMVARRVEAESLVAQRQAELSDFKGRIDYEVRSAMLDVHAAAQQLQVAQTNVQLANDELQQARDRFGAGVADNLEVTQAQQTAAAASETYIAALYAHNLAKAEVARALGVAEEAVASYLGGQQ